jgi:hypothetical protein
LDLIASYNVEHAGVHLTVDRQRALLLFVTMYGEVGVTLARDDLARLGEQITRELARLSPPAHLR